MIDSFFKRTLFCLIITSFIITLYFISLSYSFWLDELYSVTLAKENINKFFEIILNLDIHPPFFYAILKLYIYVFGDTEIAGRLFSWIACLLSVIILFNFSQKKYKNNSILLAALISSNLIFMHYSNEVRSSALCLLFSSILISSFLQNKNNPSNNFYLGSIILSLTNYLGLIYSITILSYAYLISQKKKINY